MQHRVWYWWGRLFSLYDWWSRNISVSYHIHVEAFLQLLVELLDSHGNLHGFIAMTQTFSVTWKVTIPSGGFMSLLSPMMSYWITFSVTFLCGIGRRCSPIHKINIHSFHTARWTFGFFMNSETRNKISRSNPFLSQNWGRYSCYGAMSHNIWDCYKVHLKSRRDWRCCLHTSLQRLSVTY